MPKKQLCAVHKAINLLGGKWTILILHQLCSGSQGFNRLLNGIEGINPRALSVRLKELAANGLIIKTIQPSSPPQVEYSLTPAGAALKSIIVQLGKWAEKFDRK